MQIMVRDNNVDQALRALKKKLQREGVYREMKLRRHYEKPSEKRARERAAAVRRARKLERKRAERDGGVAAPAARADERVGPLLVGGSDPDRAESFQDEDAGARARVGRELVDQTAQHVAEPVDEAGVRSSGRALDGHHDRRLAAIAVDEQEPDAAILGRAPDEQLDALMDVAVGEQGRGKLG